MDAALLAQAAALLHKVVTQLHPEPCSLDQIETTTRDAAHAAGRLAAEMWAQAVIGVAEADAPACACGATMRSQRIVCRVVLLLLGVVRLRVRRFRCPTCGAWGCPGAQALELPPRARMSQAVRARICEMAQSWSYAAAAVKLVQWLPNVLVSAKTIERVTKETAEKVAVALATAPMAAPAFQNVSRVYVSLDGILVRGRKARKWIEIQVASLWSAWKYRSNCDPPRRQITDATFIAQVEGWDQLGITVWRWFVARGGELRPGREVVVLGDGASGIRSLWELYFPKALALLDPWHLWEKVKQRAKEVLHDKQRALGATDVVYRRLRRGLLTEAREAIELWPTTTEWAEKQRARLLAFLERNADIIRDYDALREKGYMVGSGLTEKSNELVVTPRMKNGKMHWSESGAAAMALLRAQALTEARTPIVLK